MKWSYHLRAYMCGRERKLSERNAGRDALEIRLKTLVAEGGSELY